MHKTFFPDRGCSNALFFAVSFVMDGTRSNQHVLLSCSCVHVSDSTFRPQMHVFRMGYGNRTFASLNKNSLQLMLFAVYPYNIE